jgi:DNA-binding transcriptional MerR regulator
MALSLASVYNLKAVLKETGIKPDVLRAWERRYGLPLPQRTAGGHRLYSEHDIEIIKWLMARQNEGLSISHAVEMWKDKTSQGHDLLADVQKNAGQPNLPTWQTTVPSINMPSTGIDSLRMQWLSACMGFNEIVADQVLNQAFALYPVEYVCMEVLQRGMVDLGNAWYRNRASIQQEHFASALALRRLDALLLSCPAPTRSQTIILGCPANEWHTFTPLLMTLLIRRRGLNVIYLGANVPSTHIAETVKEVRADLVVLAAQQLNTAASLQQAAALVDADGGMVAFGGRIFAMHPDMERHISGHYLGGRLDGAVDIIEGLLDNRPAPLHPILITQEYLDALAAFTQHRVQLDATLEEYTGLKGQQSSYYHEAHKFMGDNITAALRLGSMNYMDSEVDWLKLLLQGYSLPESRIYEYFEIYLRALVLHLAEKSSPISLWFERQLLLYKN